MFKLADYYSNITRITTDFLFGGKEVPNPAPTPPGGKDNTNIYNKLLQLREILLNDNYYYPLECFDCINHYGKSYYGEVLVCGMHPYGLKDCPDFKSKYQAKTSEIN